MAHRDRHRPFTDIWSALRFTNSGWVAAMLAGKLARSAPRHRSVKPLQRKPKIDKCSSEKQAASCLGPVPVGAVCCIASG